MKLRKPSSVQTLVVIYVLIMMVPNVVLAVTEPYAVTTILSLLFMPAGGYILWAMLSRRPSVMILWSVPVMILCAFQLVISYLFGNSIIAIDMFTNALTTNVSEAGELLGSIYPIVIIVIVLYAPLLIAAIVFTLKRKTLDIYTRRRTGAVGLGMMVAGSIFALVSNCINPGFSVTHHIFPVNVSYNLGLTVHRWIRSTDYPKTSRDFRFDAVKAEHSGKREVYVFVIGEAARAMSWSLFGYERDTTPILDTCANVVPFHDMLTQSNTTHKSVPIMLSPVSAENYDEIYRVKSIITMFKEAGFSTAFISNQPPNRSFTDYFASEADEHISLVGMKDSFTDLSYDGELVPHLRAVLERDSSDMFIVLHTYGSHADHEKRCPDSLARFTPYHVSSVSMSNRAEMLNAYDNSISYTDMVLHEIVTLLDSQQNTISTLLYCADHGEDLMDDRRGRYLHASPTASYFQLHVASFAWFSDGYAEYYPAVVENTRNNAHAAASSSAMFHTMASMAHIDNKYVESNLSLTSPAFRETPRMYVNDYNRAVNVLQSGLTELDLTHFDQHNIKYDRRDFRNVRY